MAQHHPGLRAEARRASELSQAALVPLQMRKLMSRRGRSLLVPGQPPAKADPPPAPRPGLGTGLGTEAEGLRPRKMDRTNSQRWGADGLVGLSHLQLLQQLCGGARGAPRCRAGLGIQVGVELLQGLAD